MTKVSIVGVEGSGKTVLMAALGDKYQLPDAKGLFLSPSDQDTFDFVKRHLADLHGGRWPSSTNGNRRLGWMLCRRSGARVGKICDLSLLDYPGEAFRLSFGRHSSDELAKVGMDAGEVAAFRRHVQDSHVLILVVNLSVIVNAAADDERAWETQWLVKALLDDVAAHGKRAALVFTRADAHEALIAEERGLSGVMARWLPQVASLHVKVPTFAVAAVDRTVPSATGQDLPADDFGSQGLEHLMGWLAETARGCEWRGACRRFFRKLMLFACGGLALCLVVGACAQYGGAVCRAISSWYQRFTEKNKVDEGEDRPSTSRDRDKSDPVKVPERPARKETKEDAHPHATALAAAIDEAAKALDADELAQAQMALQRGTLEFQQGQFSGEPYALLEPLRQRWCMLWSLLVQKQSQKNIENFQRTNPYANDGFDF